MLARDNDAVDDGWLCDKGRWGYQAVALAEPRSSQPLVRDGGMLRPATGSGRSKRRPRGLRKAGRGTAALAGGQTTNEEGYLLQRIFREALGSPQLDSRAGGRARPRRGPAPLAPRPGAPRFATSTRASACWCSSPTRSTRRRSSTCGCARRCAASAPRLVVAASGPTALDGGAAERLSFAPGTAEALLRRSRRRCSKSRATAAPAERRRERRTSGGGSCLGDTRELASSSPSTRSTGSPSCAEVDARRTCATPRALLTEAENVVVIWGERLGHGERGAGALGALATSRCCSASTPRQARA